MAQMVSASGRWNSRYSLLPESSAAHQAPGPFNRPSDGGYAPYEEDAVKLELGSFPPSAAPSGLSSHGFSIRNKILIRK